MLLRIGTRGGARTPGLLCVRQALSQLSYSRVVHKEGLEPPSSAVSERRSPPELLVRVPASSTLADAGRPNFERFSRVTPRRY